ncbi:hypothetical protein TNCV_2063591 [Trichonephila clavipes]|nr:hypothetical protein TNCV_2063591 [Trichonephila clavipes]
MSRRKQRSAFDQVSEFDRGRIVAYRDCGLSFREFGSGVGRNQFLIFSLSDMLQYTSITKNSAKTLHSQIPLWEYIKNIQRIAPVRCIQTSNQVRLYSHYISHDRSIP